MIERRIHRQIERLASRIRLRRLLVSWGIAWLATSALAAVLLWGNARAGWYFERAVPLLIFVACVGAIAGCWFAYRSARALRYVARYIESTYPELNTSLLAAIDQRPDPATGRFGFLQDRVITDVLGHAYRKNWMRLVPVGHLVAVHLLNLIAFGAMVGLILIVAASFQPNELTEAARVRAEIIAMSGEFDVTIEPGTTEIERGTSLLVMARFKGPLPPDATLTVTRSDAPAEQYAMAKSLEDPIFGARIPDVKQPLFYRVEFADDRTDEFQVLVFEYPKLERADARLRFPNYTSLEDRLVQDIRTVSAVEGTTLTLICNLNKPVASAELVDKEDNRTPLAASDEDPRRYEVELEMNETRRLTLHLVDPDGRANKQPPEFVLNVLPNRPPDLKLVQPSRDMQVSPIEEVELKANAWDDYGLSRMGLSFMLAANTEEVVLEESVAGKQAARFPNA